MPRQPETPREVYTRLLMRKDPDRGFPLYTPGPDESMPPDYRARGPRIGDLGYISEDGDGGFDFLFNLCLPADHPFNRVHGGPGTFQQIKLRVGEETDHEDVRVRRDEDLPGKTLSTCSARVIQLGGTVDAQDSTSTVGAGFTVQFNSLKNEGAMLVLPHGAEKRDLRGIKVLERAAKENARYQFACANLGIRVGNDSLFVVTGYHKASSWCLASFSREASTTELSVTLRVGSLVGASINAGCKWESTDSVDGRAGPRNGFDATQRNQAIFLRGMTITIRSGLAAMLLAKVKVTTSPEKKTTFSRLWNPEPSEMVVVHEDSNAGHTPEGQATDPEISLHQLPNSSVPLHPAVMINRYLLDKFPNVDVAITHDNQWIGVLAECGGHEVENELIERVCEKFVPAYDAINAAAYFESKPEAESNIGYCNDDKQHISHLEHAERSHQPREVRQKSIIICTDISHVSKHSRLCGACYDDHSAMKL